MDKQKISSIIESILFVAGDPVSVSDIASVLESEETVVEAVVSEMIEKRKQENSGIQIRYAEGQMQLCSNGAYFDYVVKLLQPEKTHTLSRSAMETLAIVAYQQPVTRMEIEEIRGVKCNYSLSTLLGKGLIEQLGRKDVLGRPMLYGTTDMFLRHFGIDSLDDLPELPEP